MKSATISAAVAVAAALPSSPSNAADADELSLWSSDGDTAAVDPIYAAIGAQAETWKQFNEVHDEIDRLEAMAADAGKGTRPIVLVAWRGCSAIAGEEIDGARLRFLAGGLDPDLVAKEYSAVLDAERVLKDRKARWDAEVGTEALRSRAEVLLQLASKQRDEMARTVPTTLDGAAALAAQAIAEWDQGFDDEWQREAVRSIANAVRQSNAEQRQVTVTSHPAVAPTIPALYQAWCSIRDRDDPDETAAEAGYEQYRTLQVQIVEAQPASTRDLAIQLVVETDGGDSDYRPEFFERVKSMADGGSRLPEVDDPAIEALRRCHSLKLAHDAENGDDAAERAAESAWLAAWRALEAVRPTTWLGFRGLLEYLAADDGFATDDVSAGIVSNLAIAARGVVPPADVDPNEVVITTTMPDGTQFKKLISGRIVDADGNTISRDSHRVAWDSMQPNARIVRAL